MSVYNSSGEIPMPLGNKHGWILSETDLGTEVKTLKDTGELLFKLITTTPKASRAALLEGTDYELRVATFQMEEDPDHGLSIGNPQFSIDRWEDENTPGRHVTGITVWYPEGKPQTTQPVRVRDIDLALEENNESHKIDAMDAREWLRQTHKFLQEKLEIRLA